MFLLLSVHTCTCGDMAVDGVFEWHSASDILFPQPLCRADNSVLNPLATPRTVAFILARSLDWPHSIGLLLFMIDLRGTRLFGDFEHNRTPSPHSETAMTAGTGELPITLTRPDGSLIQQ
jgi:hypothetical protein